MEQSKCDNCYYQEIELGEKICCKIVSMQRKSAFFSYIFTDGIDGCEYYLENDKKCPDCNGKGRWIIKLATGFLGNDLITQEIKVVCGKCNGLGTIKNR